MSSLEELDDLERRKDDDKKDEGDGDKDGKKPSANGASNGTDAEMKDAEGKAPDEENDGLDEEILRSNTQDINNR